MKVVQYTVPPTCIQVKGTPACSPQGLQRARPDMEGCAFSWGGSPLARGWEGRSVGDGPAARVAGALAKRSVKLVAASRNSLAVDAGGRVFSWGSNNSRGGGDAYHVRGKFSTAISDSGQLGRHASFLSSQGRQRASHLPAAVNIPPVIALASGRYHALAIEASTKRVFSWGLNDHGQLGRSGWADRRSTRPLSCEQGPRCRDGWPRSVDHPILRNESIVDVAAGRYFSLAVAASGRAYAWGRCSCGEFQTIASQPI